MLPPPVSMRHWESLAAPSPIVPTGPPLSSKHHQKHFHYTMSSKQQIPFSANSTLPLPYSGETEEHSHIKTDQDVAELVHCLQTQAASASSPPGSLSSNSPPPTATGAREMFKAGHRRLRQLAQRQKKDAADPETKAEEDRQQLSALQREGLLPASAVKKSHAKKGSVDSTSQTSCKSSSRRDVERIGQPWLADPLERCMADPLMSSGRVASMDLSHLNSSTNSAVAQEPGAKYKQALPFQPLTLPDFIASGRRDSAQQALDGFLEHAGKTSPADNASPSNDTNKESNPANTSETNTTQEQKKPENTDSTAKAKPAPKNTLKLFPDPVPPRLSSKTALRLSKVPPANGLQRAQQKLPTLNEISKSALPSPTAQHTRDRPPKEPRSAPAATSQFIGVEREKAENAEQSSNDKNKPRYSALPMNAINAFPLPAPTRPLPSLPENAAADAKVPRKSQPIRNVSSPVPDSSNRQTETARQPPNQPPKCATPEPAQERNRAGAPARRVKEMAQYLDVAASGETEKRSRSLDVARPEEPKDHAKQNVRRSMEVTQWVHRDAVPGPLPTPPPESHARSSGRSVPTSPKLKHSEPTLGPAFREGQIQRSNSYREPIRNEKVSSDQHDDLRSEYPIPSSDEEGIARNPWSSRAQKKRRRAKPQKPVDPAQSTQRIPRIEKPAQRESMSPPNNRSSRSFGRSSPLSQYSQCTYHSHDSSAISILEGRIAQLERQNKILQAALLAALDVGNKGSTESLLSGTVASLLSAPSVSSKTSPASSYDERTEKSKRRETWLDTSSRRSSVSSAGEDMDFGWLSDKSSVGDSLRVP